MFRWILCIFLVSICVQAQQLPQQCAKIADYTSCVNDANQRVENCGQSLPGGIPDLKYYECQCTELTSIETCFSYCPDSPEIQQQLPNAVSNAKAWCDLANNMKKSQTTTSSTTSKQTLATLPTPSKTTQEISSTTASSSSSIGNGGVPATSSTTTSGTHYGPSSTLVFGSSATMNRGSVSSNALVASFFVVSVVTIVIMFGLM